VHFLITGGKSDVARRTVAALLQRGHRVSWVGPPLRVGGAGTLHQVARREAPWRSVDLRGVDGVLHLKGPHPGAHLSEADLTGYGEFERTLFARAAAAGIERVVAIGVVSNPRVGEQTFVRIKRQTEDLVRAAGLPATVFRVPWLYGPNDDFLTRLLKWVRNRSVLLVPGLGRAPVQMMSEARLAEAVVAAAEWPMGRLRIYEAASTTPIPLADLISQLGRIVRGVPPRTVAVSSRAFYVRGPLKLVGLIPLRSPMWNLLEGGLTCATTAFERDFGVAVKPANRALIEFVRSTAAPRGLTA